MPLYTWRRRLEGMILVLAVVARNIRIATVEMPNKR
jgi:hypothetical protein